MKRKCILCGNLFSHAEIGKGQPPEICVDCYMKSKKKESKTHQNPEQKKIPQTLAERVRDRMGW